MRLLLIFFISFLFIACAPKVNKINIIEITKVNEELLDSINNYKNDDIELKSSWWEDFKDPQLNFLINQGLNNGFTIKQLKERFKISQALVNIQKADESLSIDLNSNIKKERLSENSLTPNSLKGKNITSYNNNLTLNYNFDFWDERSSLIKALENESLAQEVLIKVKKLSISTNIARLYIKWNSQNKKIEKLEKIKRELLEKQIILEQLYNLGLSNEKKVNLNKYKIKRNEQSIIRQKEKIEQLKTSINLLCDLSLKELSSLKKPNISLNQKIHIPKNIKLNILSHIPKIAVQKYLLKSKKEYIENAKAKFYPNINLRGLLSFSSISFSNAFEKSSSTPNVNLALNLPIFDAYKREENLNIKALEYNAQVYSYNKCIIDEASKIIATLNKIDLNRKNLILQKASKEDKNKNLKIEYKSFKLGLKNKLDYLDLKIDLIEEDLKTIDLKNKKLVLQVDLYESLGGGLNNRVINDASFK